MRNINKITKITRFTIFFAVTLLVFYFIFQKVDYRSLGEVLLNANLFYLVIGFLLIFLALIFSAKKWQVLIKAMGYSLGWKESLGIVMAAYPISVVTPAKSGDLIRAYYLRDKIPKIQTAGAVVVERFVDVSILAFYSLIGGVIFKNGLVLAVSLSILFLIPLFFIVVNKVRLPLGRWREKIESFLYISKIFIHQPQKLLPVLFYASIVWLAPIFEAKILFLALGVDIPLFYIAAAFPLAIFVSLIPITIAGMGTRDSAIIYLFSSWASPSVCLGVGFLYALFAYWFLALLGLPIMKKLL